MCVSLRGGTGEKEPMGSGGEGGSKKERWRTANGGARMKLNPSKGSVGHEGGT